jgi:AcrR family transcriptional regulator
VELLEVKSATRLSRDAPVREDSPSVSNREKILDATVQVAVRDGILNMTLDAVAKVAGVSKGGLLYHFRSKDELITGMLVHYRGEVQRVLEERMAADANPRGRLIRAMIQTVFSRTRASGKAASTRSEMRRFFMAILAAAVNNPRLLDPVRQNAQQMRERLLAEGPDGVRQIALRAAIDGLMLWERLGIISSDEKLYESIIDELLTLAEGPDPSVSKE